MKLSHLKKNNTLRRHNQQLAQQQRRRNELFNAARLRKAITPMPQPKTSLRGKIAGLFISIGNAISQHRQKREERKAIYSEIQRLNDKIIEQTQAHLKARQDQAAAHQRPHFVNPPPLTREQIEDMNQRARQAAQDLMQQFKQNR